MKFLDSIRAAIARIRNRANARDTRRQAVRVSNAALRRAQARRIKNQSGLTDEQRELAMRAIGRVGGGK